MRAGTTIVMMGTLCVLLTTRSVAFAARTDTIALKNGDQLTCEVVQLSQGKLQVKTDDMGTISIEWDKVTAITTAERYDVTTRDGARRLGRLRAGPPGLVQVLADDGSVTTLSMMEIVSFAAIKRTFFGRIDGSLDLGGSYTKSSGIAQVSIDASATYRRPSHSYTASLSSNLTREADSPDTSRYLLKVGYTRVRTNRWFVSMLGLFEGNEELGFSLRSTAAVLVGRYFYRSNRVEFLAAGGIAPGREQPIDSDTVTNVDGVVSMDLSVFTYDYPTTRIDLMMFAFPSFDDPGRVRINANGKVRREVFRDFFVAVSAYDAFDNRPKGPDAARHDFGGSLSFGWTF